MAHEQQKWRSFLRTIDLLAAGALADLDMLDRQAPRKWERGFEIALLAAAPGDGIEFPASEVLSEGNELQAVMTAQGQEILVKLQLQGFAALDRFGGREARLVSDNGAIDYRFRFSHSGSAACVLSNRERIREGLCKFAIFFEEPELPEGSLEQP